MTLFERILCAVDFSEFSTRALQWADFLASRHGGELMVFHVQESWGGQSIEALREYCNQLKSRYHPIVSSGVAAEKIRSMAHGLGASLIVIGTRGLKGAAHVLLGSTSEDVVRRSRIPVVTISPRCKQPEGTAFENVLLPVSTLQEIPPGYARIRKLLRELKAKVTLIHVVPYSNSQFDSSFLANPIHVMEYETSEKETALARIGEKILKEQWQEEAAEAIVRYGDVVECILRELEEKGYDCVLMGARQDRFFSRFLGSTLHAVLCQSPVPVLTVRIL